MTATIKPLVIKRCSKCREAKAANMFNLSRKGALGLRNKCKNCVSLANDGWSKNNQKLSVGRYRARQKVIRQFFQMHIAMRAIAETLNQMKP